MLHLELSRRSVGRSRRSCSLLPSLLSRSLSEQPFGPGAPEVKLPIPTNPQLIERVNFCWIHKSKSRGGCPGFRFLVPGSWVGIFFAPLHIDVHWPTCTTLRAEPLPHLRGSDVAA